MTDPSDCSLCFVGGRPTGLFWLDSGVWLSDLLFRLWVPEPEQVSVRLFWEAPIELVDTDESSILSVSYSFRYNG